MRRWMLPAVFVAAALWTAGGLRGIAQQQSTQSSGDAAQPVPDAPQPQTPQPQKKKTGKTEKADKKQASSAASAVPPSGNPKSATSGESPNQAGDGASDQTSNQGQTSSQGGVNLSPATQPSSAKPSSAAEANPFPEDISRQAAKADSSTTDSSAPTANPSSAKPSSAAEANPFPEDVSRQAAKADGESGAGSKVEPALPPGVNSSSATNPAGPGGKNLAPKTTEVTDPVRARKDNQVGEFYLSRGDFKGAYLRYQDAVAYDPTNMDAVYGLAESAMGLKNFSEAERNYQLYLQVVPTGSKAKHAFKQLSSLTEQK